MNTKECLDCIYAQYGVCIDRCILDDTIININDDIQQGQGVFDFIEEG